MKYNFDEIIERKGTDSIKYDKIPFIFGRDDLQPLWVADMDFATPDFILEDIKKRLEHPILGYSMRKPAFFESYKQWAKKRYAWEVPMEWLTFSPGVVGALGLAILALTRENDKIIIQPPVYHPFFDVIKGNNRQLVENPLKKDANGKFLMDFEHLQSIIDEDTKMIIIANPHNPGGRVWRKDELEKLARIAHEHDLIILSDDIHADFVYDQHQYTPIASINKEAEQRTITITSPSKSFNIAGLSTSILIIPNPELYGKYKRKLLDMHLFLGNIFGNVAFESAYKNGEEWLDELLVYLQDNRDFVIDYLQEHIPHIKAMQPEGTFLMLLDFSGTGLSHDEIKNKLINEAKLALNDATMFGKQAEKHFRLNFATPRKNLETALKKLEIFQ